MKLSRKLLYSSIVAASFLLLQPLQAQTPVQPGAGSAAAADAAEIQRQAAEAMAKAVNAAARCDREELARQLAILENLNARIAEIKADAAAGMKAARRVPQGFGGPPDGDAGAIARAESAVSQLLAHARNLVPACGPDPTAAAPPAEDIPTYDAEPAPPGFGGKDPTIGVPYRDPTDPMIFPLPPSEKMETDPPPPKRTSGGAPQQQEECGEASSDGQCESGPGDKRREKRPR